MTAIKIERDYFRASSMLFGPKGLGAVIRAFAVNTAVAAVKADLADTPTILVLTDNSTGTAGTALKTVPLPSAPHDATSAGGAQLTGLNAAITASLNAGKVITDRLNAARTKIGLPTITSAGTAATAGTIPAQTKTVTAATGTSAADYVSGRAKLLELAANQARLVRALNEVLVAVGAPEIPSNAVAPKAVGGNLLAVAAAAAAVTPGTSALSKAAADAALTALADNYAFIADTWDKYLPGIATSGVDVPVIIAG